MVFIIHGVSLKLVNLDLLNLKLHSELIKVFFHLSLKIILLSLIKFVINFHLMTFYFFQIMTLFLS